MAESQAPEPLYSVLQVQGLVTPDWREAPESLAVLKVLSVIYSIPFHYDGKGYAWPRSSIPRLRDAVHTYWVGMLAVSKAEVAIKKGSGDRARLDRARQAAQEAPAAENRNLFERGEHGHFAPLQAAKEPSDGRRSSG